MANTVLVPLSTLNVTARTSILQSKQKPTSLTKPPSGSSPTSSKMDAHGLSLVREQLELLNIPQIAQEVIMASCRSGTTKQLKTYLLRWETYCHRERVDMFTSGLAQSR